MTGPQIIVLATPVFLLLIAIEFAVGHARGRNTYRLNDALNSIGLGILSQVVGLFTVFLTLGVYTLVWTHASLWQLSPGEPWVWVTALLLYDFCYYWLHRGGHRVALLWAAHVVHHQSEDYNLSTALRQTGSGWIAGWLFYLPMAVLGFPPLVFALVGLIDLLYQFWVHTQQVGKLGWFDRWFCSPSNHRVHHAVNDRYVDRNYGGILILWDRLRHLPGGSGRRALRLRHARAAAQLESAVGQPAHLCRAVARRLACAALGRQAARVVRAAGLAAGRCGGGVSEARVRSGARTSARNAADAGCGGGGAAAVRRAARRHLGAAVVRASNDAAAIAVRSGRHRGGAVGGRPGLHSAVHGRRGFSSLLLRAVAHRAALVEHDAPDARRFESPDRREA